MRTLHRYGIVVCIAAFVLAGVWEQTLIARADSSIIKSIAALSETVGRFEKFETVVELTSTFKNPYDPDEVRLDGQFTSPSGKTATVPGFYFRDYKFDIVKTDAGSTLEKLTETDNWSWRVRFTPVEVGDWSYTVQVTTSGKTTTSAPQHFAVKASESHGFLHLDKRDFRYLVFDDGTPFFGVGLNMGWYGDGAKMGDYARWLEPFSAAGGNTIRVWMAPWGFSPEWTNTPLGNYENRQDRAFELDKLFEMAEQQGIYIQLCFLNHGQFSKTTNPMWNTNPYNVENGGPLDNPEEFATNPTALKFWEQRLRYIAARWGYSTHMLAWEWWNEVNWTPMSDPKVLAPWIEKSAAYLSPLDPYRHLMTHSGSGKMDTAVWSLPSMSIVQLHIYEAPDWAYVLVDNARKMTADYKKPFLLGEFGYLSEPTFDPYGIRLRLGLWGG